MNNKNCADYTDFTVQRYQRKIVQPPGGHSTLTLGWVQEKTVYRPKNISYSNQVEVDSKRSRSNYQNPQGTYPVTDSKKTAMNSVYQEPEGYYGSFYRQALPKNEKNIVVQQRSPQVQQYAEGDEQQTQFRIQRNQSNQIKQKISQTNQISLTDYGGKIQQQKPSAAQRSKPKPSYPSSAKIGSKQTNQNRPQARITSQYTRGRTKKESEQSTQQLITKQYQVGVTRGVGSPIKKQTNNTNSEPSPRFKSCVKINGPQPSQIVFGDPSYNYFKQDSANQRLGGGTNYYTQTKEVITRPCIRTLKPPGGISQIIFG